MSGTVFIDYRIVVAISEHICAEDTLASGGQTIRIDESSQSGVVVARLEIIEAGFHVEVVTAIAQGLSLAIWVLATELPSPSVVLRGLPQAS